MKEGNSKTVSNQKQILKVIRKSSWSERCHSTETLQHQFSVHSARRELSFESLVSPFAHQDFPYCWTFKFVSQFWNRWNKWHLLPDQPLLPRREPEFRSSCSNQSANPSHPWCLGFHVLEFIILYFPKACGTLTAYSEMTHIWLKLDNGTWKDDSKSNTKRSCRRQVIKSTFSAFAVGCPVSSLSDAPQREKSNLYYQLPSVITILWLCWR